MDCADFSDAEVRCEWQRIDILIICRSAGLVVAIENKIDASEHSNQLSRYSEAIAESDWKGFKQLFVFLTVDGSAPEKEKDRKNWICYSHEELVKLLKRSLDAKSKNLGHDQDVLIRHYIELMRRRILSDSKVAKLAQKIYSNHKQAIELIIEHRPDSLAEVITHPLYVANIPHGPQYVAISGREATKYACEQPTRALGQAYWNAKFVNILWCPHMTLHDLVG